MDNAEFLSKIIKIGRELLDQDKVEESKHLIKAFDIIKEHFKTTANEHIQKN